MEIHKNKYKNKTQNMTVYKGNKLIMILKKLKLALIYNNNNKNNNNKMRNITI
jgi:hypothetical protein